jgi:SAM-dependent methyltransferase
VSSKTFDAYASYYDLLYRDKDYAGEADYIHALMIAHSEDAKQILELGCGTGAHAEALMKRGYRVSGVDLSERMIENARRRVAGIPGPSRPEFNKGDLRDYRDNKLYDAVLALFHVMSYQTRDEDLRQAFGTASAHLLPGGLFIFDYWHGPGVLSDPPVGRSRVISDEIIRVTRTASPTMLPDANQVDVEFDVTVEADGQSTHFCETHRMRYFFLPEIQLCLAQAGMLHVGTYAWMTSEPVGNQIWYACTVAQKI